MGFELKRPGQAFFLTVVLLGSILLFRLNLKLQELYLLFGGLLGAYLWEYESEIETFLKHSTEKSLLRNVFTQVALAIGAFYALTSPGTFLAAGFAYGLFSRSVIEQVLELKSGQSLVGWFWLVRGEVEDRVARIYLAMVVLFTLYLSRLLVA